MPFPAAPRVIYELNPLDEVVCELRFPPILKIDIETPAAFQDLIRVDFPNYEIKSGVKLPPGIPSDLAKGLFAELSLSGQKTHVFSSRDGVWRLTLTRQTMALTCGNYQRWERFKERLSGPYDALKQLYPPTFFSRVGLRYRDVIRRSELGLNDARWGELLQPWISGVLGSPVIEQEVFGTQTVCEIKLPDERGRVKLRYGLAIEERPAENEGKVQEVVFMIDSDLYVDQETEPSDVISRLDTFNEQSGRLFRWCITERLHNALRPGAVPPR